MSAQQLHDKMLSADVPVQQRLLEEHKRFQQQQQQRTQNIQRPRSQSSCLWEVAAACEDISPCCCACVDRHTVAPDYERETEQQKRAMYFCACGKSRQHPLKAAPRQTANADAFLIDSQIVGVADGVGSVETEGYDPALLPIELLTQCSLLFRLRQQNAAVFDTESETTWTSSGGPPEGFDIESFPLHILARAHASCVSLGSTTCVLGMLDCRRRRLYTVNVGDSRLLLLRRFSSSLPLRKRTITVEGSVETATVSQKSVQGGCTGAAVPVSSLLPSLTKAPAKQEGSRTGGATVVKRALEAAVARATEATAGEPVTTPEGKQGTAGRKVQITGERRLASNVEPTAVASTNSAGAAGGSSLAAGATCREGMPPQEDERGVAETSPLQSAAVVEVILQPAEKSPPAEYVVAARNSVAAAVEETDSRGKQGQQRQPIRNAERAEVSKRHEFDSWGYAIEEERRLQATEEDASGWFERDGERISVPSLEKAKPLRESDMKVGDGYKVVYRTEAQQHFFNCPYQLTRMPDIDCSQEAVLRRTQASADLGYCDVKGGDIIVVGSDGLFDNLFEDEIVAVVNAFCCRDSSSSSNETGTVPAADPALVADQLLNMALAAAAGDRVEVGKHENGRRRSSCCGRNPPTPFSQAAYEELGRRIEGGKPDDTTVVVAFVVETQRQEVSRWQMQKQAQQSQKRSGCLQSSVVSGAAERGESNSMNRTAADVPREPAAVADARWRIDNPASDREVVCAQGSHPVLAAATRDKHPAGKIGATATFATETAASVPVAAAGVGVEGGPDAAEFAKRRATTFSIEEMSTSVCEEKPQTSIANPGKTIMTSSSAVHGRYRSSSLSTTPECSGSDYEATFLRSEQADSEHTVTTSLRRSQNSTAGLNKAEQIVKCSKQFRQSNIRKGEGGGIFAHCAGVAKRDSSNDTQQKVRDIKQPHVLRKETLESGGPQFEVARAGTVCMPATVADTMLREQQERHEQQGLATDAARNVATSHSTTIPTITGITARQLAISQRLPPIGGWWLFCQPQADSHLTLVMRAAPTPRSQVTKMHDNRNKTESRQMHRYARPLNITPSHQKHEKHDGFGVDLHPPTDQETAATRASTLDKQHRQMQTRDAAAEIDSLRRPSTTGAAVCAAAAPPDGKSLEKNRFCVAPSRTANTAVATTRASTFSGDERVDAALSACASFKITQDAAGSSRLPHCSNGEGEGPIVAPRSLPSHPSSDGSTRRGPTPTYTCQASPAGPAPVIALTSPAPVAGAIPLAVGGTYPTAGGVSRRPNPVSVSTILACSRRSFPPIHAASLRSLRVHPQATCLQQIYAAEKRQALTPAAAAAAVGAGTSPACVAAVHMKILDRRGC